MVESKALKLQTVGERECLSLHKEEAKDGDAINNITKNDLEVGKIWQNLTNLSPVFMSSLGS